jgi:hypothetical protein
VGRDGRTRISTFQPLSAFHKTHAPADGGPQASISSDKKNDSPFRTLLRAPVFGAGDSADPTGFRLASDENSNVEDVGGSKFSSPSAINRKSRCGFNVCGFINNSGADHIDLSWQEVSMRNCESRSCNRIESWPIRSNVETQLSSPVQCPRLLSFPWEDGENNTRNRTEGVGCQWRHISLDSLATPIFSSSFRVLDAAKLSFLLRSLRYRSHLSRSTCGHSGNKAGSLIRAAFIGQVCVHNNKTRGSLHRWLTGT